MKKTILIYTLLISLLLIMLTACNKDEVTDFPKNETDLFRPKEAILYLDGEISSKMELSYENSKLVEAVIYDYEYGRFSQQFKVKYDYIGQNEIEEIFQVYNEGSNKWENRNYKIQLKFNGELVSEWSEFYFENNNWEQDNIMTINFNGSKIKNIYYSNNDSHWNSKSEYSYTDDFINEVIHSRWDSRDNSISESKHVYFYSEGRPSEIKYYVKENSSWTTEPRYQVFYGYSGNNITSIEWNSDNSEYSKGIMEFEYDPNNNLIKHTYSPKEENSSNYVENKRVEYVYEKGESNSKFLL